MARGVFSHVVRFQGNNTAGNQTITDPRSPGMAPILAIFALSGATALDTLTTGGRISVGATDGTNQYAIGYFAEDGGLPANQDTGNRADDASVLIMPTAGGLPIETKAAFSSFASGSVTITWSVATQLQGFVIFVYASNATRGKVTVDTITGSASIGGTASSTAHGEEPDFLFVVSGNLALTSENTKDNGMLSIGWASRTGSVRQGCAAVTAEDNRPTGNTSSGVIERNDCVAVALSSSGGTVTEGARLEASFGASGYTMTTRNAAAALAAIVVSISVDGEQAWAGVETVAAGTTGDKAITTPGFRPLLGLFAGVRSATVNSLGSGQGNFTFGAVDRWGEQAAVGLHSQDNQTTAASDSVARDSDCFALPQTGSAHDWIASGTLQALGVTLNVNDATTGDRILLVGALGEDRPAPVLRRPRHQWAQRLARM